MPHLRLLHYNVDCDVLASVGGGHGESGANCANASVDSAYFVDEARVY